MDRHYQFYPDKTVFTRGVKTRYWEAGEGKKNIVLVHGLGGCSEIWSYTIPALIENGYHVFAFDMVGSGKTAKPDGDYTYPFFARFLFDFIEAMHLDKVSVIGHSFGGGIALRFAEEYPEKLNQLVLVCNTGLGKEFPASMSIMNLPLIGEILSSSGKKPLKTAMSGLVYNPEICEPEWYDRYFNAVSQSGNANKLLKTVRLNFSLFGARPESLSLVQEKISSIKNKTLVVWGKQDEILPYKHANFALKHISNSELFSLDLCGHRPMIEYPEAFNNHILEFLNH